MLALLVFNEEDDLPSSVLIVEGTDDRNLLQSQVQAWKNINGYYGEEETMDISDGEIVQKLGYKVTEVPYVYSSPYDGICLS